MARKMTRAEQARLEVEARQAAWDARPETEKLALRIQSHQWSADSATKQITALMDSTIQNLIRRAEELRRYRENFTEGKSDHARPLDYANWFIGQAAQINAGIDLGTIAGQMAVLAQAEAEIKAMQAQLAAMTAATDEVATESEVAAA